MTTDMPLAGTADRTAIVRALRPECAGDRDASLQALVRAAARLAATPIAAVTAIDDRAQHLLACVGMPSDSQSLDEAFCTHAIEQDALLEVPDTLEDPRFAGMPGVSGAVALRFYAGQPLTVAAQRIGTLCVVDRVPRRLDASQRRDLAQLGHAVAELLDSRLHLSARRERDAMLRQLSAQVPGVMYTYEEDAQGQGRFRFISDGIERELGVTPAAAMAHPDRLFSLVHPDDVAALREALAQHRRDLTPLVHAYRQRRPDGQWCWIETRASPQRLPDGGTRWHAFSTDVTRRRNTAEVLRRTEERWLMAAAAAGIGIAEVDTVSGELRLDARACANHGLPYPHPRFTLDDWLATIDEACRARVASALDGAIRHGEPLEQRFPMQCPDGQRRWLEVVARAGRTVDGRATSLVGTCRDVTAQEEARQLARAKAEAERASRAKTAFLSRVSHELRTPLNAILGFAQLMALDRDHPLQAAQASRLAGLRRAGSHLLELINDVLDLSRIEREDFGLRAEPVEVQAVIATCVETVQPLAVDRGIALHAPAGGECHVLGDARAIEQVLMNLLSNAIKFNRIGGEVRVSVTREGDRARIAVRDTGTGIERAAQARLFQAFERLGAERRRIEGSGLGLVIARELAEAMGGRIDVHSEPGAGSTFTLELPASTAEQAPAAAAAQPPAEPAPAPAAAAAGERRVLYIEDEALNQLLMQEIFRACPQWTLSLADSGAQGLALARDLRPDLLLIDMNLPDADGLALIARLRADPATRELPCIAVSADAMGDQIDAARAAGFDDYWTKPVDVHRVITELSRRLGEAPKSPSAAR
ncbi:ATP-binding protein [Caldimonas sp. KR1-144]|uniref:ATP-binding protein n=1 Tax=Caldimonas sp. KR1-144 TaxID=3400911 RepID=UPI003BFB31B9